VQRAIGSPGTNLAGSSNLAGSLPHELVINLGKVESNMAGIFKDILSGPGPLLYVLLVYVYLLLTNFQYHFSVVNNLPD
jgi:hypothetical protein